MRIHTYLRTRIFPNYPRIAGSYVSTFEQRGSPNDSERGGGWSSLLEMQWNLAERNYRHCECLLLENGIRITPHPGYGNGEHHQDILWLEEPTQTPPAPTATPTAPPTVWETA